MSVAPSYSLFQNGIGRRRRAAPCAKFPMSFYDFGVREAVADIAKRPEPSAVSSRTSSCLQRTT